MNGYGFDAQTQELMGLTLLAQDKQESTLQEQPPLTYGDSLIRIMTWLRGTTPARQVAIKVQLMHLTKANQALEDRVVKLERQLAALMALHV
jgi:hypothetical protein